MDFALKNLNCKKYFMFKINNLINNSFHTFEEKRMESLLQYCTLVVDTYEEYHTSVNGEKLKKSYVALLRGLLFQIILHPFGKLEMFDHDFKFLKRIIKKDEDMPEQALGNIHMCVVSLKKKVENVNLVDSYFQCIEKIDDFQDMDFLLETFISDMLYKGISLAFLSKCISKMQEKYFENENIDEALQELKLLDRRAEKFIVNIKFTVGGKKQTDRSLELIGKDFSVFGKDKFIYASIWEDSDYYVAQKEIEAIDEIGAVDIVQKEFHSIIDLFDMWQGTKKCIKDDPLYGVVNGGEVKPVDVKQINNVRMLSYIDDSHRKQMERFLQLRDLLENEEIETLERIFYTLNTAKRFSVQNRLLNFWSALEYTLYQFPRNTIIEKARVVVPKAFTLFYIKNKMNIFWKGLLHYMKKRTDPEKYGHLIEFIKLCRNDDDYVTKKVVEVLLNDEKTEAISDELTNQVVLQREFMELQMLIAKPSNANKVLSRYYEGIVHDLDYIYRLRNRLIHSAKQYDRYLEFVSMRIYRYVSALVSTILYYKEKNPENTIMDILNSIDVTFDEYQQVILGYEKDKKKEKKKEEINEIDTEGGYRIIRPAYLFME